MKKFLLILFFLCVCSNLNAQFKPWAFHKPGYSQEASQYISRLAVLPGTDTLNKYVEFIDSLVKNGIWVKIDEMWMFAHRTEANALIGLKNKKNCLNVNSTSFTAYRGFTSNGTTSYLTPQLNLSTEGVNYTVNSASIGVYSRTNANDAGLIDMGGNDASNNRIFVQTRTSNNFAGRINELTGDVVANSDSRGFFVINRNGAGATQYYKNATNLKSGTTSSSAIPNINIYICCRNSNGTAGDFSTKQLSFAFVGASLTSQEVTNFNSCLERLLDYLSAGVQ